MIRMLRMNLYHRLVNRVPMIRMKYHDMRKKKDGPLGKNVHLVLFTGVKYRILLFPYEVLACGYTIIPR